VAVLQEEVAEVPVVAGAALDDVQINGANDFIFFYHLVFQKS
jgi:hypothetical protein